MLEQLAALVFYCWTTFQHMLIPHFTNSSSDGYSGRFYFLTTVNSGSMYIHIQVFVIAYVFKPRGYKLRNRLAESYGPPLFNLLNKS